MKLVDMVNASRSWAKNNVPTINYASVHYLE